MKTFIYISVLFFPLIIHAQWELIGNTDSKIDGLVYSEGYLYASTKDSVQYTGATNIEWHDMNFPAEIDQAWTYLSLKGNRVFATDYRRIIRTDDFGEHWTPVKIYYKAYNFTDPENPWIIKWLGIYEFIPTDSAYFINSDFQMGMTKNLEDTVWQELNPLSKNLNYQSHFVGKGGNNFFFNIRTHDGYCPDCQVYENGLYVTYNYGKNWMELNNGFPKATYIRSMGFNYPTLYAGTYSNGLFVSHDYGSSWHIISNYPANNSMITYIKVIESNILVNGFSGTYLSNDKGETWLNIKGNLPEAVRIVTVSEEYVYVALENSIYRTRLNNLPLSNRELVKFDISVFPNPTQSVFYINTSDINNKQLIVFNALGRVVQSVFFNKQTLEIDCNSWTKGIYFLNIRESGSTVYNGKIIIN